VTVARPGHPERFVLRGWRDGHRDAEAVMRRLGMTRDPADGFGRRRPVTPCDRTCSTCSTASAEAVRGRNR